MSPWLEYKTYAAGHRFTRSVKEQSKCYIVRTGAVSIHRQPDDILIDYIPAPTIRGIIPIPDDFESLYVIKIFEEAEIAIIDIDVFDILLSELNLWEPFARHMQLLASLAPEVIFRLNSRRIYEAVRMQLYELMAKPESIREQIIVENFIRAKVQASRSAVMHILSELRKGEYVVIENGVLKSVNSIPERF
ncbi:MULTISPECIES: helix-turn-helix domain-containing protein [Rahnella]|uniref:Helix-turn-helix domain-containing protein n=1 Tax=Rahnella laticis TaxID=2787622 RepID=A0ABS0E877_9GAMM|nr:MULTISPECIES: helix-turn-helix domain-containing protein [Rahnella]MBF7981207.1 helix-turn-helix domain-containing protein [Rahnella laticis]MBF8001299.1 helix-turn-helix domain-containing protein [Rahnella sp. LAC-M12]